jgi:hypothetical protein
MECEVCGLLFIGNQNSSRHTWAPTIDSALSRYTQSINLELRHYVIGFVFERNFP